MEPDQFTCFPRFHQTQTESCLKRAGRYQRKLIREFRAYITRLDGVVEVLQGKGPLRILSWRASNPGCTYGGLFVSQYTSIAGSPQYHFRSEVIVQELTLHGHSC